MTLTINRGNLAAAPELLEVFLRLVRDDVNFLQGSYPDFDSWLTRKVLPGILKGERTVVIEQRGLHTVGLLILKHTDNEKKLCTLRVRPEFEYRGLGVRLFNTAFELLGTSRPLLSVSEVTRPKFERLFEHFGFACEASYKDLYLPKVQEFSYNGILTKDMNAFEVQRTNRKYKSMPSKNAHLDLTGNLLR